MLSDEQLAVRIGLGLPREEWLLPGGKACKEGAGPLTKQQLKCVEDATKYAVGLIEDTVGAQHVFHQSEALAPPGGGEGPD